MPKASIVGDVINFRGFVYGPVNEMGVVAIFSKICDDLGYIIEEIKASFPDCIARWRVNKGWQRVGIEFEFKSSNFELHGHDPEGCDLIVCWEHDWQDCPLEVLSLKNYVADGGKKRKRPYKKVWLERCRFLLDNGATSASRAIHDKIVKSRPGLGGAYMPMSKNGLIEWVKTTKDGRAVWSIYLTAAGKQFAKTGDLPN